VDFKTGYDWFWSKLFISWLTKPRFKNLLNVGLAGATLDQLDTNNPIYQHKMDFNKGDG